MEGTNEMSDSNRLVSDSLTAHDVDLDGLIAQLKKIFFTDKKPIDDDETDVHKLCVRLENVLRYGLREKYTFLGLRKDYWSYVSECLAKDETIRFIQSIPDVKTFQGKGRALLRQALMEKTLADTLQRCVINDRLTREYYVSESVLRSEEHFKSLLHSLYDLNAVDFNLPLQGYDLDRSWPSFSRKSFSQRKDSSVSESSVEIQEGPDPLIVLHSKVASLNQAVLSLLQPGENKRQPDVLQEEPSMHNVIEAITVLQDTVLKFQMHCNVELEQLRSGLKQAREEKAKVERDMEIRLKQMHGRQVQLARQESDVSSEKLRETYEKLMGSQQEVNYLKEELRTAQGQLLAMSAESKNLERVILEAEKEKEELGKKFDECRMELSAYAHVELTRESTQKVFELKLAELQKANSALESRENDLISKLRGSELALSAKSAELQALKEAIEKGTGEVTGSVRELHVEVNQQGRQPDVAMKFQDSELQSISSERSSLERQIEVAGQKYEAELKRREDLEKTVAELKAKLCEELRHESSLQNLIREIYESISESGVDETDLPSDDADGSKSDTKREKEAALRRLFFNQQVRVARDSKAREDAELQVLALQSELAQVRSNFEDEKKKLEESESALAEQVRTLNENCESLRAECKMMKSEVEKCHEEMFSMSHTTSTYQSDAEETLKHYHAVNCALVSLQSEVVRLEEANKSLAKENGLLADELVNARGKHADQVASLKRDLENVTTEAFYFKQQHSHTTEWMEAQKKILADVQEELDLFKSIKDQELQGLKFQLSTEEMKHQSVIKALLESNRERDEARVALDVEKKLLADINDMRLAEAKTESENENATLKERLMVAERELMFLKTETEKLAKEKEDEKAKRQSFAESLANLREEKKTSDKKFRDQIAVLESDCVQLKETLVNAIKDKQDLWKKSEILEFEVKQKIEDRWVKDEEVVACPKCKAAFGITLRKHHCRLCGQIFCHNCSGNWLETPHSRKKVRACDLCASLYTQTYGRCETDGSLSDVSTLSDRIFFEASLSQDDSVENKLEIHDDQASAEAECFTDTFEILDPAEVTNTGAFGESEAVAILSTDLRREALLATICDGDTLMRDNLQIQLAAGQRCLVPVVVGSSKVDLLCEFTSQPKDIGFGVAYKASESADDSTIETVQPLCRYVSHRQTIYGQVKVEKPGVFYLVFSNSYSRLTSKQITCSVGLRQRAVSS